MIGKIIASAFIISLTVSGNSFAADGKSGKFVGDLVLKAINGSDDDHTFELVEEFTFIDRKLEKWTAPKGAIVNGA